MVRLANNDSALSRHAALAGVCWLALACGACGGELAPVLNIESTPIVSDLNVPPSSAFVHDAVVRALVSREWQIDRDRPEGITATAERDSNRATILITYSDRTFSIHRVSSSLSLEFDGSSIDRRYNQWIDGLRVAILAQLGVTEAPPSAPPPPPEPPPPSLDPNPYGGPPLPAPPMPR
jgi:hypothetical protein